MKRLLLLFIIFVLVFSSILAYDHRESSCFNSPTCVLERARLDKENLLLIYKDPDGWVAITYTDGTLREVQVTLKREFLISRIEMDKKAVNTTINYDQLIFSAHGLPPLPQNGQFLVVKVNDTVRVLKGEELTHVLRDTPKLDEILEERNNCTLIFGDRASRPVVDSNPLIGGYLVFPTEVKCGYSTWITVTKKNNSTRMTAIYPLWEISGSFKPKGQTPLIKDLPPLPIILNRMCEGREIFINASGVIINPFPSKLLDEIEGLCPAVDKITIYPNGTVETLRYMKECWLSGN